MLGISWPSQICRTSGLVLLAAFFATSGNAARMTWPTPRPLNVPHNMAELQPAQAALRRLLLSDLHDAEIVRFYTMRNFRPVWSEGGPGASFVSAMRNFLADADVQGLQPEHYMSVVGTMAARPTSGQSAAEFDVALTTDLLRYMHDMRDGRVSPKDVYRDVELPAVDFDAPASLAQALNRNALGSFLMSLEPAHPEYRHLAVALQRYRGIATSGGWKRLKNGSDDAAILARLVFEDPSVAFTSDAREALQRYQTRNGLTPDGVLGPETLASLNVPVGARIAQIEANMERWRWLPAPFERRYIAVNVPDQSVEYVRDGEVILHSRVIVGKARSSTPILRTEAVSVVANPPWNIPGDIAAAQLLPQLKRNPNYLKSKNMVLVDGPAGDPQGRKIDWRNVPGDGFPYRIRQIPGPDSALGVLMLDMPNSFDVYLHDTPGKAFFKQSAREISNGCIRVEQIFKLASLALTDDAEAGSDTLNAAIAEGDTENIRLAAPLPVYLLYWTAVPIEDGTIGFRPDRYDRDKPLIAALVR